MQVEMFATPNPFSGSGSEMAEFSAVDQRACAKLLDGISKAWNSL